MPNNGFIRFGHHPPNRIQPTRKTPLQTLRGVQYRGKVQYRSARFQNIAQISYGTLKVNTLLCNLRLQLIVLYSNMFSTQVWHSDMGATLSQPCHPLRAHLVPSGLPNPSPPESSETQMKALARQMACTPPPFFHLTCTISRTIFASTAPGVTRL